MGNKQISRKEFFTKTITGIAGLGLVSKKMRGIGSFSPELRGIGNTGIMVSPICFEATRTNEGSLIKYVIDKGINFIDTGRSYANGNNERLVGQAIAGIRKKLIIQSKIRLEENELPSKGRGRKGAEEIRTVLSSKLEESLRVLNTDYIDIMLFHDAIDEKLLFHPEVMKFYSEMKKNGVLRACGFSAQNNFLNLHQRNNTERFYDTIMVSFNHKGSYFRSEKGINAGSDQTRLITILKEAWEKGIGVVAMETCSGGKYSPSSYIEPSFKEAVYWVLNHEFISSAAVVMANFEQVEEYTN